MASVKLNSSNGSLNNNNGDNNHGGGSRASSGGSGGSSSRSSNSPSLAGSGSNSPAAAAAADCPIDAVSITTTANDLTTSSSSSISWVGSACGHYGPYTFYKAVKLGGRILAMGDFFLVKPWSDQEIVSIGELQLLWEDDKVVTSNHQQQPTPLVSVKLYFLPENTPEGRHEEHGEVSKSFFYFSSR